MAFSNQPKSSTLLKILREALVFLLENWKPLLVFTLLYFIFSLSPILSSHYTIPILTLMIQNLFSLPNLHPPNPDFYLTINAILTELRQLTIIESVFFVANFVVFTLLLTSTLCFLCLAYTEKQPTLKELFSKMRRRWKGAMVTQFYVTIFMSMSGLFLLLLTGGFALVSMNSGGFLVASFVLSVPALLLFLYLNMIWSLSVVVSVEDEEERMYGLAALLKATEMMKGRRWMGIWITLLRVLVTVVCVILMLQLSRSFQRKAWLISGVFIAVAALVNIFNLSVLTVFYFECKKGYEGLAMMSKGGLGYVSLVVEDPAVSETP